MKKYILITFSIIIALFTISCDSNKVYESNVEIPDSAWDTAQVAVFQFGIEEKTIPYNLKINVRHTQFYVAQNLWLFIKTTSPSNKVQYDTLNCQLADDKGKWLGDGMGEIFDLNQTYKQNIGFPETGQYKIEIKHGMRMPKVPMIMEIGFRVETAEIKENK
jgi:gliding motility-associated lipoprotein GldH